MDGNPITLILSFITWMQTDFEWNGIQIEGNQEQPLQGYEQELLASVGADRNTSRVIRTYWTSDVYTDENGETCRNARADIEQYVNYYRANYEKETG